MKIGVPCPGCLELAISASPGEGEKSRHNRERTRQRDCAAAVHKGSAAERLKGGKPRSILGAGEARGACSFFERILTRWIEGSRFVPASLEGKKRPLVLEAGP